MTELMSPNMIRVRKKGRKTKRTNVQGVAGKTKRQLFGPPKDRLQYKLWGPDRGGIPETPPEKLFNFDGLKHRMPRPKQPYKKAAYAWEMKGGAKGRSDIEQQIAVRMAYLRGKPSNISRLNNPIAARPGHARPPTIAKVKRGMTMKRLPVTSRLDWVVPSYPQSKRPGAKTWSTDSAVRTGVTQKKWANSVWHGRGLRSNLY